MFGVKPLGLFAFRMNDDSGETSKSKIGLGKRQLSHLNDRTSDFLSHENLIPVETEIFMAQEVGFHIEIGVHFE